MLYNICYLYYKDVTGKFMICHVFSRKVYPRRPKVSQNAGKFVWQIIYRTKEKCLAEEIGYVTKKLAKWFGCESFVKSEQIDVKFNKTINLQTIICTCANFRHLGNVASTLDHYLKSFFASFGSS